MMKRSLIACFILTACNNPQQTKLDSEAWSQSAVILDSHINKCGEGIYATTATKRIVQFQRLTAVPHPEKDWKPDEADKLNGLEWTGTCTIITSAFRVYENGQWSEWKDLGWLNSTIGGLRNISLKRVRGEWKMEGVGLQPVPCNQIPVERTETKSE